MSDLIIHNSQNNALQSNGNLAQAGAFADQAARANAMGDYMSRKATNTIRRHKVDLAVFVEYLKAAGVVLACEDFQLDPTCWRGVTWGLVKGFVNWQLLEGYAVGSINVRLTTVKTYAKLAYEAGMLEAEQYLLIKGVTGYGQREGVNLDAGRTQTRKTRPDGKAVKKAESIVLTADQVKQLLAQDDTEQGRRDVMMLHLMAKLGLRCGEVAGLTVGNFNLGDGYLTFRRPKVNKVQTHEFDRATLAAVRAYFDHAPLDATAPALRSSNKSGKLTHEGMSERAITKRVKVLGQQIGVEGLSAHDLRHTWATLAARLGTAIDRLQDAGGWNSPAMPLRYVKASQIANKGVRMDE